MTSEESRKDHIRIELHTAHENRIEKMNWNRLDYRIEQKWKRKCGIIIENIRIEQSTIEQSQKEQVTS